MRNADVQRGDFSRSFAGCEYDRLVAHGDDASAGALSGLTGTQRGWAVNSEHRWQRAHAIAAAHHPGIDVSDVYHAMRCLALTPSQRLAAGLRRERLRAHAR